MEPYVLIREIQVNRKRSDHVVKEISLPNIDVPRLNAIFWEQPNDPLFYSGYQINQSIAMHFAGIQFDFQKFDYYLVCYRELTSRELEILTINRYFNEDKAKRYVGFVMKDKTRPKFLASLAHLRDLNYSKFRKVTLAESKVVLEQAAKLKLSTCYVISENKQIDGQYLNVESALEATIGYGMGTILVFGGGAELIYYEGEDRMDRWISIST
jgi:hypothetical protein